MRVLDSAALQRPSPLEEAYQVFRLERQGNLLAPRTLEFYDRRVGELIDWLRRSCPPSRQYRSCSVTVAAHRSCRRRIRGGRRVRRLSSLQTLREQAPGQFREEAGELGSPVCGL